jgi:hypothetical protein
MYSFEARNESRGANEGFELIKVHLRIRSQNVFGEALCCEELKIIVAKESAQCNESFVGEFHCFEFLFIRKNPS